MLWIRAHRRILSLTLLCSLMGTLGGFFLGRGMLLRVTTASLSAYARELMANSDGLADEINLILTRMSAPGPPLCSDADIELLRARTFQAGHVKDIGRTYRNTLLCSAFLGRLTHPYVEGPPSLAMRGGFNIYTDVAVLLASKGEGHGTIVEAGNVDVVLNSDAFGNWDRPHLSYMLVAVDRQGARMLRIAGSPLDIDLRSVLLQRTQIVRGTLFQSFCSVTHPVCVVTAERIPELWASSRATQIAYSAMGGFAGLSFGLILFVFHRRNTSLSHQLWRAVQKDSPALSLVYQPIIDVRSGRCTGAEALLRWRDRSGVSIAPDVFIPVAEEIGLIKALTALVVRRATRELLDMLTTCDNFTLSMNIAAADLGDEQLFRILQENVCLAGIPPSHIALELTERSTADLGTVSASIQRLSAQGYKVHIDDFGVGFSSLSYLDQLQVNAIKIDRTFTRTIGTDAVIAPILSQMLDMARSLGVEVIVEGVETELQRDYLAASGVALRAQGWFFSKPLSARDLRSFDAQNKAAHESTPLWLVPVFPDDHTRLRRLTPGGD